MLQENKIFMLFFYLVCNCQADSGCPANYICDGCTCRPGKHLSVQSSAIIMTKLCGLISLLKV